MSFSKPALFGALMTLGLNAPTLLFAQPFDGYYRLQTLFQESNNRCLEGNKVSAQSTLMGAAFLDNCQWVSGQFWAFESAGNGYYTMKTQFLEADNKCLDQGNFPDGPAGGRAYMADCTGADTQLWKIKPFTGDFVYLQTKASEASNACLEGNRYDFATGEGGGSFMTPCGNFSGQAWSLQTRKFVPSPEVPTDLTSSKTPYPDVVLYDLAHFAWREFAALNYPADPNHRGKPLAGSSIGDAADARVWETYWHRVEMFPGDKTPVQSGGKADVTAKPSYKYTGFALDSTTFGGGTPGMDASLWNNLDEDNELNVDEMFAHVSANPSDPDAPNGFVDENRIVYEAKMNEAGFNYVLSTKLYDTETRDTMVAATKTADALTAYGGTCGKAPSGIVSLPCGVMGGAEGNIEIKAAWRKLNADETASGAYYTNKVIRYQAVGATKADKVNKWFTDTYGLIGLHIIHKTANFPTYVFATFEHKDNIASGIGYIDEITQNGRGAGDVAGAKVIISDRDNPIPNAVKAMNSVAQTGLAGTVWANYQLVGVQAHPVDYSAIKDSTNQEDISTYLLSNIVIESNEELQNFRGGKAADQIDMQNTVIHGTGKVNMGGCLGCHGVAQLNGSDFNFLIKNSPFTAPEVVGSNVGIIDFIAIKSYADVLEMLNSYVKLNGIGINGAPHGKFWDGLSYTDFKSKEVFGVRLVTCGTPETSGLVKILEEKMMSDFPVGFPEMPAGGPYFPEEQIKSFSAWVGNNCPE
ncbi:RICIN domain-containing protein [Ascidiaceihabitans sp.]|uniref:RICIN domain-containing protein n=1 Tax=Ascidiaceihabitans sp. TaxID=1872644 RepID=UPI003299AA10